jgi:steroid 5-alpha reductase family enzyme
MNEGAPLFLLGMFINVKHDRMLISLRKDSKKDSEGKTEYKIPRGFLFEYISGANYFGEIVEWWSLALITQGYPQVQKAA